MASPRLIPAGEHAWVLDGFRTQLPVDPQLEPRLHGVLVDSLEHPGNLFRAQLAYAMLRHGGLSRVRAREGAIGVEYFHTASLILDDLPSMDNASRRRGRPCPHRTYGEAAAMLGALAFVNQAYGLIWSALRDFPAEGRTLAGELLARCLGPGGILNGQALDLNYGRMSRSPEAVRRIAEGKTVSLVRLTLGLPAILLEGAGISLTSRFDRLAWGWGSAYQILDDFRDLLLSPEEATKSTHRDELLGRPNLPRASGTDGAWASLRALLDKSSDIVAGLGDDRHWDPLRRMQALLERESSRIAAALPARICA